jgi:predicted nucleic acid-binding protein
MPANIVIDTSAILAVLLDEREKQAVVEATTGTVLCAPGSLRWEVGNAATAGIKRRRLTTARARQLVVDFEQVTIRELAVDILRAVDLGLELASTRTTRTFWKQRDRQDSRCSRSMVRSGGMPRN